VFVSNKSYNDSAKGMIVTALSEKSDLETVIAFERFPEAKTSRNIADWLKARHAKAGLNGQFIMCHLTDGASNAVGSSMEFQSMMDAIKSSLICHYTCYAHQVNRLAKFASGTGDFVTNNNKDLSIVLKKLHEINGRVFCSKACLKVLFAIQAKKNRLVLTVLCAVTLFF
jgi:hypothetical protein